MLYGYSRVSTQDQLLDLQNDALKQAGCKKIYSDHISGIKEKPELSKLLSILKPGDTLIVWRLDRLGRSLQDLIEKIKYFETSGIMFKSLSENIDTSSPGGKLIFHIFGAMAEFERNLIRERVNAGLQAARARGRIGGRRVNLDSRSIVRNLHKEGKSIKEICKETGITRPTYYAYVKEA